MGCQRAPAGRGGLSPCAVANAGCCNEGRASRAHREGRLWWPCVEFGVRSHTKGMHLGRGAAAMGHWLQKGGLNT